VKFSQPRYRTCHLVQCDVHRVSLLSVRCELCWWTEVQPKKDAEWRQRLSLWGQWRRSRKQHILWT